MLLEKKTVYVFCPEKKEDVIGTIVSIDNEVGLMWVKIARKQIIICDVREILQHSEIIVYDPEKKEDVIGNFIKFNDNKGKLVWVRIDIGRIIIYNSREILEKNTEENIQKVFYKMRKDKLS